mgnify:CR=1 FL=1
MLNPAGSGGGCYRPAGFHGVGNNPPCGEERSGGAGGVGSVEGAARVGAETGTLTGCGFCQRITYSCLMRGKGSG